MIFRSNQKCAVTVTANFLVFDDHTIITKLHRVQTKFDDFVLLRQGTDGEDGKSLDGQDKLDGSVNKAAQKCKQAKIDMVLKFI